MSVRRRRLGVLMSLYFVWGSVFACVRVVEYDRNMPIVDCCIEYIVQVRNNVVLWCGHFGQLSLAPDLYKTSRIGFVIYRAFFRAAVLLNL
jgi:hypothetical protein